jgi:predicted nucleic acid-binding protein
MVFLDANVPMYVIGAEHPNKALAATILRRLALDGERTCTDVEVFQEILHRYTAIRRNEAIPIAFELLDQNVDEVFPIDRSLIEEAKNIVLAYPGLSARDAIHVAVLRSNGIRRIVSFDEGFDAVAGIERIFA